LIVYVYVVYVFIVVQVHRCVEILRFKYHSIPLLAGTNCKSESERLSFHLLGER